ncbi:hypothetical protein [Streptomyces sp. NPDC091268]|uniref:hypothetical protein n=1 Tax=Streptomyces sp. NPDC091268 TaxID=3365979 RepID=UPI00382BA9E8
MSNEQPIVSDEPSSPEDSRMVITPAKHTDQAGDYQASCTVVVEPSVRAAAGQIAPDASEDGQADEVTDLGAIQGTESSSEGTSLGRIPVTEIKPEPSGLELVPVGEVQPEDVGMFSVRYTGRMPQLVLTGGTVVPSVLTVVDGAGNILAEYTARAATTTQGTIGATSRALPIDQNQLVGCPTPDCNPISLAPSTMRSGAIQAAQSIGGLVLTTETSIADKPRGAEGPEGMGGMQ